MVVSEPDFNTNYFGDGVGNCYFLCLAGAIKILKTQSLSVESAP